MKTQDLQQNSRNRCSRDTRHRVDWRFRRCAWRTWWRPIWHAIDQRPVKPGAAVQSVKSIHCDSFGRDPRVSGKSWISVSLKRSSAAG